MKKAGELHLIGNPVARQENKGWATLRPCGMDSMASGTSQFVELLIFKARNTNFSCGNYVEGKRLRKKKSQRAKFTVCKYS